MRDHGIGRDAPIYFVSSNTHSLVNLLSGDARAREAELVDWVQRAGPRDLKDELAAFREERTAGSWNNFLYFLAREQAISEPGTQIAPPGRGRARHRCTSTPSRACASPRRCMPLSKLDPAALDDRLGEVDAAALQASRAIIVNIDYPLGLAAYNILREITEDRDKLRGVYILGKAATLNADVGDVMISSTIHDEHSGTTYWLDNAFDFDAIAPYLRFGSGLDNQRAVTVRSTFLQNREYLDRYYREGYTVVEMEAGPVLRRGLRDRRARPLPRRRAGQLLQAADRLRDRPLRLRHAVHPGAHARRPRHELLRHGLHLRDLDRDLAPDLRPGGCAGLAAPVRRFAGSSRSRARSPER